MKHLRFRRALLISSAPPSKLDPGIEHIAIPPMSYAYYSHFMLKELHRYIDTEHALVVQADGFVINPRRWNPEWLSYDYIGAPWRPIRRYKEKTYPQRNLVGNGGFSLRSRRLMQLVSEIDLSTLEPPYDAEDLAICEIMLDDLLVNGIRFAPPEIAAQFSIEDRRAKYGQTIRTSFGFHGSYYLERVQPGRTLRRIQFLLNRQFNRR